MPLYLLHWQRYLAPHQSKSKRFFGGCSDADSPQFPASVPDTLGSYSVRTPQEAIRIPVDAAFVLFAGLPSIVAIGVGRSRVRPCRCRPAWRAGARRRPEMPPSHPAGPFTRCPATRHPARSRARLGHGGGRRPSTGRRRPSRQHRPQWCRSRRPACRSCTAEDSCPAWKWKRPEARIAPGLWASVSIRAGSRPARPGPSRPARRSACRWWPPAPGLPAPGVA